jgi:hypothetical protein
MPDARADIYKCKEADGSLTYSQTPCPNNDTNVVVSETGTEYAIKVLDCRYANRFANETATAMRDGAASTDIFDQYGGIDALSGGSISIINYVYVYRTKNSVSAERIADLTEAQCIVAAMPDVACKDLPRNFTDSLGGCDRDPDEPFAVAMSDTATDQSAPATAQVSTPTTRYEAAVPRQAESTAACRTRFQDEIDSIDARMRGGYTSPQDDALIERRRDLSRRIGDC